MCDESHRPHDSLGSPINRKDSASPVFSGVALCAPVGWLRRWHTSRWARHADEAFPVASAIVIVPMTPAATTGRYLLRVVLCEARIITNITRINTCTSTCLNFPNISFSDNLNISIFSQKSYSVKEVGTELTRQHELVSKRCRSWWSSKSSREMLSSQALDEQLTSSYAYEYLWRTECAWDTDQNFYLFQ